MVLFIYETFDSYVKKHKTTEKALNTFSLATYLYSASKTIIKGSICC